MTIKHKPTRPETKRFIAKMRRMKEAERGGGVEIFTDNLLRVTLVVRHGSDWWLVPKTANGWQRRQRLNITPEVRTERLTPATGITAAWLGVTD